MVWGLVSEGRTNHQEARSLGIVTSPDVLIFCVTFAGVLTFASLREILCAWVAAMQRCDLPVNIQIGYEKSEPPFTARVWPVMKSFWTRSRTV
jgi:hypothetical protein